MRILIADADPVFRDRVKRFLGEGETVVGEAGSGEEAYRLALEGLADVVLMDIGIPGLDALATTRSIKDARAETRVILMTAHDEEAYLAATGKSGADAFLPKRNVRAELLSAIRRVASGLLAKSPAEVGRKGL